MLILELGTISYKNKVEKYIYVIVLTSCEFMVTGRGG